jgi:hypothetical protein
LVAFFQTVQEREWHSRLPPLVTAIAAWYRKPTGSQYRWIKEERIEQRVGDCHQNNCREWQGWLISPFGVIPFDCKRAGHWRQQGAERQQASNYSELTDDQE